MALFTGFPFGVVRPSCQEEPEWPLDVASTTWFTVTVFIVCVMTLVGKVVTSGGVTESEAKSARKTRAKPGAGTVT